MIISLNCGLVLIIHNFKLESAPSKLNANIKVRSRSHSHTHTHTHTHILSIPVLILLHTFPRLYTFSHFCCGVLIVTFYGLGIEFEISLWNVWQMRQQNLHSQNIYTKVSLISLLTLYIHTHTHPPTHTHTQHIKHIKHTRTPSITFFLFWSLIIVCVICCLFSRNRVEILLESGPLGYTTSLQLSENHRYLLTRSLSLTFTHSLTPLSLLFIAQ
jgi:hypothetical protein